ILYRLSIFKEITEERNCAVACALGGALLATGLISAGAVCGEGGGLISAVIFFALGQISLAVFSYLYMRTLPFNVHDELKSGNVAAGLSFGGALVALGLIIMSSASGPQGGDALPGPDNPLAANSVNWAAELISFGLANAAAFVFLPVLRWIGDRLIVPGRPLSLEIKEDRNIGAGLIQATALICFGALLAVLI
ncbi:DUF350 domain-containing protein, partial [Deltaproteobacteria bacterium OttesenSCG-928-K17]|nr:DUF350 domain-containing protein [Deltaproteobacteria bacterium OttesenSCG-928-K17]